MVQQLDMIDKKNILVITNGFPYGDSERSFISAEIIELQKKFNVVVAALNSKSEIKYEEPRIEEVYCIEWSKLKLCAYAWALLDKEYRQERKRAFGENGIQYDRRARFRWILKSTLVTKFYEKQISSIVKKHKIELVYTYWCTEATIASIRLKRRFKGLKVVSRVHGYDLYTERSGDANWQSYRQELCEGIDRLFFICQTGKNYFITRWPEIDIDKCAVSYIGSIEPQVKKKENCAPNLKHLTVASCSTMLPLKRINLIIEALEQLDESHEVSWIHLGAGPLWDELTQMAREKLDCKSNIKYKFYGFVDNCQIPQIYTDEGVDCFITTSETEGLPISVVEAMSMGIPIVATNVGGMSELVIDDITGWLFSKHVSSYDLSTLLKEMKEEDLEQMSHSCKRMWQRKFDAQRNAAIFAKEMIDI